VKLDVKVDTKALNNAFMQYPLQIAKELRLELNNTCKIIQLDAMAHHRFNTKSGRLKNSVHYKVEPSGLSAQVALDKDVKYAGAIHDGSKPHRIYPKNKNALAFVKNGRKVLVPKFYNDYWRKVNGATDAYVSKKGYVNHPGTSPDPFLYEAATRQEPRILKGINAAIGRVLSIMGSK
jgi:hypothetical protein